MAGQYSDYKNVLNIRIIIINDYMDGDKIMRLRLFLITILLRL